MDAPIRCVGRALTADWSNWPDEWLVACVFPNHRAFVCVLPPLHAAQPQALIEVLDQERTQRGLPPMSEDDQAAVYADQIDLFVRKGKVQIRPEDDNINLALRADELLQETLPKLDIEFLNTSYPSVRKAIKRRGELWRITPPAHTNQEINRLIAESRVAIAEGRIYYYNRITGTRYLTYATLRGLASLSLEDLRRQLLEIATVSRQHNHKGRPEIALLGASTPKPLELLQQAPIASLSPDGLRELHCAICEAFAQCCPAELQEDDPNNGAWQARMACYLTETVERYVPEEAFLGLSAEFLLKVKWLPGGRIQDGDIFLETDLARNFPNPPPPSEEEKYNDAPDPHEQVRGIIFNFFREYPELEYINVGRVLASLGDRPRDGGRRGVYLVETKQKSSPTEAISIIRLQKWDVWIHLNEGHSWEHAMARAAEYTDYVLDRRLGCQQLGMRISPWISQHSFPETYRGSSRGMYGTRIWSIFFQREYLPGIVTSKTPRGLLKIPSYARTLATLLGEAAAINMIVGRTDHKLRITFDDGDEVLVLNENGWPVALTVADPTGAFGDYGRDLSAVASDYATPYLKRIGFLDSPREFLEAYLAAFIKRFKEVQADYTRRRTALRGLFAHQPKDPRGNFSFRWDAVLNRLEQADAEAIAAQIRAAAEAGTPPATPGAAPRYVPT